MSKYTPTGNLSTKTQFDAEFEKIANAINDQLDRVPDEGVANQMEAQLDMNSNRIINLGAPVNENDAARLKDITAATGALTSVKHINEFRVGGVSDAQALVDACNATQTLLFGGTTLSLDEDFVYPDTGGCTEWLLQGCTINLTNNAQIRLRDVQDNFNIFGNGATIDGGLKRASLTSDFVPDGINQVWQVGAGHGFVVGDNISSSYNNNYLPNSESRVGGGWPLSALPEVTAVTATTITIRHPGAPNEAIPAGQATVPTGAELFNARFDKRNIAFNGSGLFVIQGVNFQNCPNAYAVDLYDDAETLNAAVIDVNVEAIALDASKFRLNSLITERFKVNNIVDIGKQCMVWSNETKHGRWVSTSDTFTPNNNDAIFYTNPDNGTTGYMPEITASGMFVDGTNSRPTVNTDLFALDLNYFLSFASSVIDTFDGGRVYMENCTFNHINRNIFGSTFSAPTNTIYQDLEFDNCNSQAELFYDVASNTTEPRMTVRNGTVRANQFRLANGMKYAVYDNCLVTENFPLDAADYFTEVSDTTTRAYRRGEYVQNTANNNKYICITTNAIIGDLLSGPKFELISTEIASGFFTNGTTLLGNLQISGARAVLDNVRLPKRDGSNETKLRFLNAYGESTNGTIILEDFDNTDTTTPDVTDWITGVGTDQPNYKFRFDLSTVIAQFGGQELSTNEFHLLMKHTRSDSTVGNTAPIQMTGAFAVKPPVGTLVEGIRDRNVEQITGASDFTIGASALAGTSTVNGTSAGAIDVGDWIGINVAGTSQVDYYEITADLGGDNYTVRPNLVVDIDTPDNAARLKHSIFIGDGATQIFSGEVDGAGTAVSLPSGWSSVRNALGDFTITHNLGTVNYSFVGSTRAGGGIVRNENPANANSVNYTLLNTTGASVDNNTTFILKVHD